MTEHQPSTTIPDSYHKQAFIMILSTFVLLFPGPILFHHIWKDKNILIKTIGPTIINTQLTLFSALIVAEALSFGMRFVHATAAFAVGMLVLALLLFTLYIIVNQAIQVNARRYDKLKMPFHTFNFIK